MNHAGRHLGRLARTEGHFFVPDQEPDLPAQHVEAFANGRVDVRHRDPATRRHGQMRGQNPVGMLKGIGEHYHPFPGNRIIERLANPSHVQNLSATDPTARATLPVRVKFSSRSHSSALYADKPHLAKCQHHQP